MEKGFTLPVLDHGYVRYIDHMGSDASILEAARVSYKSPSKGPEQDRRLLEYLHKNKHTSPFEMAKVQLNIKLPIFVMRQYVRHRMQNLNEVSARYTQLPNEFYIPNTWRLQDPKNKQGSLESTGWNPPIRYSNGVEILATDALRETCAECYRTYTAMLEAGIAREMARMVLPVNIYTEIYACWDMKNLLHFIALRDDAHAQAEIQEYGKAIKQIVTELFPWVMGSYKRFKWMLIDTEQDPNITAK